MNIVAYVLFFLAGLAFGYAAAGKWKFLPIIFPVILWLVALLINGFDPVGLVRLVIAIVVIVVGVLLGTVLDSRESRGTATQTG